MSYWVTLRFHASGAEVTYTEKTAANRATLIILTTNYADVIDQGER